MNSETRRRVFTLIIGCLLAASISLEAAPTDIQPPPQVASANSISDSKIPDQPISSSTSNNNNNNLSPINSAINNPAAAIGAASVASSSLSSSSSSSLPQKLPNINIYINTNEIKKLLGIESRINYVTNGNVDTYPFGFTIPLGYNQTDMIFTWQNLGQTKVNYSISLVIGNVQAVEVPLINITRSGQIPTQEQVFKITLPCSGKMSVEVDFQVLINITGYVDPEEPQLLGRNQDNSPTADGLDSDPTAALAGMQSDQAQTDSSKQMRLVSHTLVLNRKKICTIHPVAVATQPRRPFQKQLQQQHQQIQSADVFGSSMLASTPPTTSVPSISSKRPSMGSEPTVDSPHPTAGVDYQTIVGPAAINPFPGADELVEQEIPRIAGMSDPHLGQTQSGSGASLKFIPPPPGHGDIGSGRRKPFESFQQPIRVGPNSQQQQQQHQSRNTEIHNAYTNWPDLPNKITHKPILIYGNEIDLASPQMNSFQQQQPQSAPNNSPLVFTMLGVCLLISIAIIVVAILGSSTQSASGSNVIKQSPLDKLSCFTNNILLRRTPGSSQMVGSTNKCSKSVIVGPNSANTGAVISSFRVPVGPNGNNNNNKSQASSLSGLSAISGGLFSNINLNSTNNSNNGSHFYKTNCGYYTTSGAQQQHHHYHYAPSTTTTSNQHHYQHPPTADLLGTGYSCQQVPVVPPPPHPPQYPSNIHNNHHHPHHQQTTRLIWNSGNGTSPDGFTVDHSGSSNNSSSYVPLSNAPRSDTGSVYQTIY